MEGITLKEEERRGLPGAVCEEGEVGHEAAHLLLLHTIPLSHQLTSSQLRPPAIINTK